MPSSERSDDELRQLHYEGGSPLEDEIEPKIGERRCSDDHDRDGAKEPEAELDQLVIYSPEAKISHSSHHDEKWLGDEKPNSP